MSGSPGTSLLRGCARIVPSSHRDEWLAEWEAESRHAWQAGEQTLADAIRLRLRCAGAIPDALWMRRRHHARVERANMLRHYVTFALRQLRRKPGYASVVIGTLALCIGANTAVFSVVNSILYDSLSYRELDRLVNIWSNDTNNQRERNEVSVGDYRDYRERARTLASVAAYFPGWNVP